MAGLCALLLPTTTTTTTWTHFPSSFSKHTLAALDFWMYNTVEGVSVSQPWSSSCGKAHYKMQKGGRGWPSGPVREGNCNSLLGRDDISFRGALGLSDARTSVRCAVGYVHTKGTVPAACN